MSRRDVQSQLSGLELQFFHRACAKSSTKYQCIENLELPEQKDIAKSNAVAVGGIRCSEGVPYFWRLLRHVYLFTRPVRHTVFNNRLCIRRPNKPDVSPSGLYRTEQKCVRIKYYLLTAFWGRRSGRQVRGPELQSAETMKGRAPRILSKFIFQRK